MFRHQHQKQGKGQIHGSHKPKMLAEQRRAGKPKKSAKKAQPEFVPQDLNQLTPFINIDLSKLTWPVIIIMLILIPGAMANSNILRALIDGLSVNDQSVELLPPDAKCRPNSIGISNGEICEFGGTQHYLKLFTPYQTSPEVNSEAGDNHYISYEEFNRQFAKNNIGIEIPDAKFYKKSQRDKKLYIGSKQVDGLMFTANLKANNKQLGKAGVAKWAVASTFINDLHANNVGFTKDGIVLIDMDGNHFIPTNNLMRNVRLAAVNIDGHCPDLSIFDVAQMIDIYRQMQSRPLPEHHDEFNLTNEMYQSMLQAYIGICENVIETASLAMPNLPQSQRTGAINRLWLEIVKKQIPQNSARV